MVTSRTSSLFTAVVNCVKLKSATFSPVLDFTTAQISTAVTAITTQKIIFLTAEFTDHPPPAYCNILYFPLQPCPSCLDARRGPAGRNLPFDHVGKVGQTAILVLVAQTISNQELARNLEARVVHRNVHFPFVVLVEQRGNTQRGGALVKRSS